MKRNATAVLWFLAVWTVVGALVMFEGWPALLAPAAGVFVGAMVWLDPAGWLWKASSDAAIRRRRLADLPRASESPTGARSQPGNEPIEG